MEYLDREMTWGIEWSDSSRRIDSAGRVSIPSKLKNALKIECGDTVDFGLLSWEDEPNFIVVSKNTGVDVRYRIAAEALKELGLDVPERLVKIIENRD